MSKIEGIDIKNNTTNEYLGNIASLNEKTIEVLKMLLFNSVLDDLKKVT